MIFKVLHVSFNPCNKNLLFIFYYQACKYRIAVLLKAINILDCDLVFIYFENSCI